jgi:transcriptional regulator with XRE-family HTH domain
MNEPTLNSSLSTLVLLVLKEIRLDRGVHQGHLAKHVGKTPSGWTKIENGQSPLTTDALFGACEALQVQPSYVMNIVERLGPIFNSAGCYFQTSSMAESEDDLLKYMLIYFNSAGYDALRLRDYIRVSVTAVGNVFLPYVIPTVVRYCCEPIYREWIDSGAQANEPLLPVRLLS